MLSDGLSTDEFDYPLDDELVARTGAEPRDSARLLVDCGDGLEHRRVSELPDLLEPSDVVVLNDTRVLPARVRFTRPTGGSAEVLLLEPDDTAVWWRALVRPSAKIAPGSVIPVSESFGFEFGEHLGDGLRLVRPIDAAGRSLVDTELLDALDVHGEMPLPPYLGAEQLIAPERYQTVYSRRAASAAAPTAGLHFTPELLDDLRRRGITIVEVELVVGLGTFRPMTTDRVEDHVMHHERYRVSPGDWAAIVGARAEGRRVVAVGTTVVRALESAASTGELAGSTDLFIRRGFDWKVVDVMLTNFHLPRSTLLVMIDAFVGARWRELYRIGAEQRYRMLSLGDAMLLTRSGSQARP